MPTAPPILRVCVGGLSLLAACRGCGQQEAAPVKLSEQAPVIEPKQLPPRTGPFSNPETDPPKARTEAQLPPDELAAVVAKAREHLGKGEQLPAIQQLDRCANKVPQSVECEAELGIVLAESKRRKAH